MSENDDDNIEFDFFDEEPATGEKQRTWINTIARARAWPRTLGAKQTGA